MAALGVLALTSPIGEGGFASSIELSGIVDILAADREVARSLGSLLVAPAVRTLVWTGTGWQGGMEAPAMMAGSLAGTFTGVESADSP